MPDKNPNTFGQDFNSFVTDRVNAAHRNFTAKNAEYRILSDEKEKLRVQIEAVIGRKLFEEFENKYLLREGISVDNAYIQGFVDGLEFKKAFLGRVN